jgi:DNA-binding transcriptional LysR family regulator
MRFKGLDLNLIVTLDILLEERSVSAAARRLHLSQPATSAALARLREFFDDEILVLLGKSMYPTPFAESVIF